MENVNWIKFVMENFMIASFINLYMQLPCKYSVKPTIWIYAMKYQAVTMGAFYG